jgi:PAS domain S-box-containing protein
LGIVSLIESASSLSQPGSNLDHALPPAPRRRPSPDRDLPPEPGRQRRGRSAADLLTALTALRQQLARGDGADPIRTITEGARRLLDVELARTVIVAGDGRGPTTVTVDGRQRDGSTHPEISAEVRARDRSVVGRMIVADRRDRAPFDSTDHAVLAALAQLVTEVLEESTRERRLQAVVDHAPTAIFLKDAELRYVIANQRAADLAGASSPEVMIGRTDADFLDSGPAAEIMASDRAILAGGVPLDEEDLNHLPGRDAILHAQIFAIHDGIGRPIGIGGVVSDVTDRRQAEQALAASEERYRTVFEQAQEGIVLVDDAGRYVAGNPAACAMLGMTEAELLASTVDDVAVEPGLWDAFRQAAATSGPTFVSQGDVRLRRRDGEVITVEYNATAQGANGLHVGILRDVTERRLRDAAAQQRLEMIAAIRTLNAMDDVDEGAAAICRAIVANGGFAGAAVFAFSGIAGTSLVAAEFSSDVRLPGDALALPPALARSIRRRIRGGPWVDDWSNRTPIGVPLDLASMGVLSTACIPVAVEGQIVGMLAVGGPQPAAALAVRLPDLVEIGELVSARLAGKLRERSHAALERRLVRRTIARRAFHPVFQPIVDLATGEVVGYEGLTRFADRTPPDRAFRAAAAAGVGIELEVATMEAILEASGPLPANRYLDINVSPDLILAREPLRTLLRDAGFNVVLEVTEHAVIDDYRAIRRAIESLGDHVALAVDDAGAGFASLRHIVELQPAYVKLDRGLIEMIDVDLARQAMVAGLEEFAVRLGVTLIAAGVEREAERATLLELKLRRAQGFLFGRPMPAADLIAAERLRKTSDFRID